MRTCKRFAPTSAAALALLAASGAAHAGSGIDVAAAVVSLSCQPAGATMQVDIAVTAGAAAPFALRVSTGGAFIDAGTFSNWTSYGPTKGAEETLQVTVPVDTAVELTICVAQPGNGSRSACTVVPLAPACDEQNGTGLI